MKDPYSVLGAKKGDDPQELLAKYNALRTRYDGERKLSGDAGNDGKRKLRELDEAWYEITNEIGEVREEKPTEKKADDGAKTAANNVKGALDEIDKELTDVGKKISNSKIGKSLSDIGNELGKAADDFMASIFGKKKK